MTYARSRLWLGITGVGILVVLCAAVLLFDLPGKFLSTSKALSLHEIFQLSMVLFSLALLMAPLDFLGGYYLPYRFGRGHQNLTQWIESYWKSVLIHVSLYIIVCSSLVMVGGRFGLIGALVVSVAMTVGLVWFRYRWMLFKQLDSRHLEKKLEAALQIAKRWNAPISNVRIVSHKDPSFTGGIVGLGKYAGLIIPAGWVERMPDSDLAVLIARRSLVVNSGSYARGVLLVAIWNLTGFALCASFLPGAGVGTVAELVTALCGFTLWSFAGLLILPTSSRRASLQMDGSLAKLGVPSDLIVHSAKWIDHRQDDEPSRPRWIERIFHPVPSVSNRHPTQEIHGLTAWNVARNALYLSWACGGFLSRAVHCNVGKPELWTMLPSD
jgi:hypothetical protein